MEFSYRHARLLVVLLLATVIGVSAVSDVHAQNEGYSYTDKLFGKRHVFTPKADEVMVRFEPRAAIEQEQVAQSVASQFDLEIVHDEGLEEHRFAVFGIPSGKSAASAVEQLGSLPRVAAAYPAMIDQDGLTRYFLPDQLTVQFHKDLSEQEMLEQIRAMGSEIEIDHWTPGYYTISVPPDTDVFDAVRAFIALPTVRFSELSFISFNDDLFDPNDAQFAQQWSLHNDGTNATGATADADADLREAWDIERGDPNIIVVVIDSGVEWYHPDLAQNILVNQPEDINGNGVFDNSPAPGGDLDGIDNDGNGLVDDVIGWDFASNDNDPDGGDHGTACAGIVAAVADNMVGVAGAAHGVRVMPLRINLTAGMNQNRADAINFAVNEAAKYDGMVLSNSWRASGDLTAIQAAVMDARAAGVLPIFAAGNFNTSPVTFPAQYDETMAVAATSPCDTRKRSSSNAALLNPGVSTDPLGTSCDGEDWWGTNSGDDLNIGAPGVLMATTDRQGLAGYGPGDYINNFNGTSSATPLVAAIAGLVLSHNLEIAPATTLTPDDLEDILESSADKVGGYDYMYDPARPGFSFELGAGRVNALRALQELIARTLGAIAVPPVDIALSIDRSGSMGPPLASAEKFLAAKNAATQVVRLMNVEDRVGVTSYATTATTDFAMAEITSELVKDAAIAAVDGLVHGGATTIGGGLLEAQGELISAFPPQTQAIILMSDGQSNTAPFVQPVLDAGIVSTTYTIGFGTPGFDVDEDTLEAIANQTGGAYFFAGAEGVSKNAIASEGALTLIKGYQASFHKASQREMIKLLDRSFAGEATTEAVPVDEAIDEMRFSLLWDTRQSGLFQLVLEDPDGNLIDPSEADVNPLVEFLEDETLNSYRVRLPKPGTWLMHAVAATQTESRVHFSAAAYTTCKLVLNLIPRGPELLIQARVLIGGEPVPGAAIRARIHTPSGDFTDVRLEPEDQEGEFTHTFNFGFDLPGTYSVEAFAEGTDAAGFPFLRYDVASSFLGEREPVHVGLPSLVGPPGSTIRLPILVHTWVHPLDMVTAFQALIQFDPSLLTPTGEVATEGMLTEDWQCGFEELEPGSVVAQCEGPGLEGDGSLAELTFQVNPDASVGSTTRLVLAEFEHTGSVDVETSNGSFTVGTTVVDQQFVTVVKPEGWSLTSLPVALPDGVDLRDFFSSFMSAFHFVQEEGYVQTFPSEPVEGFWLNLSESESANLVGGPVPEYSLSLPAGWSIIGGLTDGPGEVSAMPEGALQALFVFVPGQGYVPADVISVGEGAWVNCSEACEVTVEPAMEDESQPEKQNGSRREVVLMATGEAVQGHVNVSRALLGRDAENASRVPYPPSMPAYTAQLRLLAPDDLGKPVYSDIRAVSEMSGVVRWVLELDPNGSSSESRTTTITWNADALRALADVPWTLRDGADGSGVIRVADMRSTTSLTVSGSKPEIFAVTAELTATGVEEGELPARFALLQNYPNPFNPRTTIHYDIPEPAQVVIGVYNVLGQHVQTLRDGQVEPGRHVVDWDGRDQAGLQVPSGVYFCRMEAAGFVQTQRMILLK